MGSKPRYPSPWAAAMVCLMLLALAVRVWRLDRVPPGWRDDELSNLFALVQHILDGDLRLYYLDASGQEALYYWLMTATVEGFGRNPLGIRGVSVFAGVLSLPLTYVVGMRLFNRRLGLIAAAALCLSFWSLMYSRIGLRQSLMPVFMLAAFALYWRGLRAPPPPHPRARPLSDPFLLAGGVLGMGLYTYFAAWVAPVILLVFSLYLSLWQRPLWRLHRRRILLMFSLTAMLGLPLARAMARQPADAARVVEVAQPLAAARAGDFAPLLHNVARTFNMIHSDGDDEWLYNIPFRPVFGFVGATAFWLGVALCLWQIWRSLTRRAAPKAPACAFLLAWWLVGISPAFISTPAGSLGHTIAAQPATYLLAALPVGWLGARRGRLTLALAALLVGAVAVRDLPDYFVEWPARGNVRFLYRADIADVARFLPTQPSLTDFGITGLLAGPWDRLALDLDTADLSLRPRWYNPERAILLAVGGEPAMNFRGYPETGELYRDLLAAEPAAQVGSYALTTVIGSWSATLNVCFVNGLCAISAEYTPTTGSLDLTWQVQRPLDLPPQPIFSFPPPPNVYAGARLSVFAHLWDADGNLLLTDDGLWVDALSLQPGDVFRQRHYLIAPSDGQAAAVAFGLYDPLTSQRLPTTAGADHVALSLAP